jgi:hypothetical protein
MLKVAACIARLTTSGDLPVTSMSASWLRVPAPPYPIIHRSAWKGYSAKFTHLADAAAFRRRYRSVCVMRLEGGKPMFCRVALHEKTPGSVASDDARGFRNWVKKQPGFVDGYHVQDSETGRMYSITIWESEESMEALRGHTPPGGSLGIVTDREELFDVVERY